jgi:glutamine amidotransferase
MCRWIAYHGEVIPLDSYVIKPVHSLVKQSVNSLESTATFNGDGFGLGWYGEPPEPGLYKEVFPAWSDENLLHLGKHLRSHLFFAHVRAATGTAVSRQNCHPFACGKWLFMHNGLVANWQTLRRDIERMIPNELYPYRGGTTDSEALFLAMMPSVEGPSDPVQAAERMVADVTRLVDGAPFRFTAALADGRDLYAFRYAANDASNTLYYRAHGHAVVVASEPLDQDRGSWIHVPENSALVARWGVPPQIVPFAQGLEEVGAVANSG